MPITFDHKISFVLNQTLTQGDARVDDLTDWNGQGIDPADVEIGVGYRSPDGTIRRLASLGQAGNIFPGVQGWGLYRLYAGADGKIQSGTYSFEFFVSVNGGESATITATAELCAAMPAPCLKGRADCLAGIVYLDDKTPWESNGWTVSSRLLALNWPDPNMHAPVTGSTATISTGGEDIWTGTWTGTSAITATKGTLTVTVTIVEQFKVMCDLDGCRMLCMLKATWAEYMRIAGPYPAQAATILDKIHKMVALMSMLRAAVSCGEDAGVDGWIAEFKALASNGSGSDCGCGCADGCDGGNARIVPLQQATASWTPTSSDGSVVIAPVPGGFDFTVDPQLLAIINSLRNYSFTSPDGSIDIVTGALSGNTIPIELTTTPGKHFITWDVTFDMANGTSSSSSPVIYGDSFVNTVLITPIVGGYVYSITGIFPDPGTGPVPFKVWCDVKINGVTRIAPYNNTHRFYEIVEPKIVWDRSGATTYIAFSFKLTDDALGGLTGMDYPLSYFSTFISSMKVSFMIYKVD